MDGAVSPAGPAGLGAPLLVPALQAAQHAAEHAAKQAKPLPPLRDELRLLEAAPNADGTPAWMIQDPVANRFFRIGWLDFELLLRWDGQTAPQLLEAVAAETLLDPAAADVETLVAFLFQNSLIKANTPQAVDALRQRASAQKPGALEWLLHNYLFFRVPLVRPQHFLQRLLALLPGLFTRATAITVLLLGVLGLFLAARQWETFSATFVDQLSWSGLLGYGVALAVAKSLHELAHALTATRYGVRVAHMGVAFLVMFPMLYTDTSESWKLRSSRQRLAIASAGIVAELSLAALATLAWSLASDGPAKSALFFLATTSWLLTMAVNASPFMRFDGYFILMDWLDFPNLHERSGALARTWLRRTLLGWRDAYPETLPSAQRKALVAFALVTWAYRAVVFLGIALLVYHYFFKLLGVFLMAVELAWFIGKPVWSELRAWHARKGDIQPNRRWLALSGLVGLLALGLVPWHGAVYGPGWLHARQQQVLYAPLAAQLVSLPEAGPVQADQVLMALQAPDLALSAQRASGQADARGRELLGLAGLEGGEERRAQVQSQQARFAAEAQLYAGESQRLQLRAPFAGVLTDIDPQLAAGVWVQPRQALATVIDTSHWVVEAFVDEADVARVQVGHRARVYRGKTGLKTLSGRVVEVDSSRLATLPHAMLEARAGGPVATADSSSYTANAAGATRADASAPRDVLYRVKVQLDAAPAPNQTQMALTRVVIEGQAQAFLPSMARRAAAVLVRESGF